MIGFYILPYVDVTGECCVHYVACSVFLCFSFLSVLFVFVSTCDILFLCQYQLSSHVCDCYFLLPPLKKGLLI